MIFAGCVVEVEQIETVPIQPADRLLDVGGHGSVLLAARVGAGELQDLLVGHERANVRGDALAARDYFFDTPLKRAWFENFTNLVPMDRQGSLRESLRLASESLHQGYHLLIFPEGTRSVTGELLEFKPTLGYLALQNGVDILPMYLEGTYDALPKGSVFPKRKDLKVRIGPVIAYDEMKAQTKGMAKSESYRYVTKISEDAVRALKEGRALNPASPHPERTRETAKAKGTPPADTTSVGARNGNGHAHAPGTSHDTALPSTPSTHVNLVGEAEPKRPNTRREKGDRS